MRELSENLSSIGLETDRASLTRAENNRARMASPGLEINPEGILVKLTPRAKQEVKGISVDL